MTKLETEIFPQVIVFLKELERQCKGCLRRGSTCCEGCHCQTAKYLLDEMNPKTHIFTASEIAKERRKKIYALLAAAAPKPCYASELDIPNCSKNLRSLTLHAMVQAGEIIRRKKGQYPTYTVPTKGKK